MTRAQCDGDIAECATCHRDYDVAEGWFSRFCSPKCALPEAEQLIDSPKTCGTELAIAAEVLGARALEIKRRAQRLGARVSTSCRHSYGLEVVRGDLAVMVDGHVVMTVSPGEFMERLRAASKSREVRHG